MQLEKIITLANRKVFYRFLAMERSLRATGCTLPLWVIPYDEEEIPLPGNALWWSMPEIRDWLKAERIAPVLRKYQCLTTANYQFVDSDVIFLRNPEKVLVGQTGFIASCGHWRDPGHAVTAASKALLRRQSSLWPLRVFNSGQFACDRALYSVAALKEQCASPDCRSTCLNVALPDQAALNLLVALSGVPVHNLTLPPTLMESTWVGDYLDGEGEALWPSEEKKPYLLHWAGVNEDASRPIDRYFLDYLSASEQEEFQKDLAALVRRRQKFDRSPRRVARRLVRGAKAFFSELRN